MFLACAKIFEAGFLVVACFELGSGVLNKRVDYIAVDCLLDGLRVVCCNKLRCVALVEEGGRMEWNRSVVFPGHSKFGKVEDDFHGAHQVSSKDQVIPDVCCVKDKG